MSRLRMEISQLSTAPSRQRAISVPSLSLPHLDNLLPSQDAQPDVDLEGIDLDKVPWWTSYRFRLAVVSFCGFACLYAQRVNLSIAIVKMVGEESDDIGVNSSVDSMTPSPHSNCPVLSAKEAKGEFNWSKKLAGLILGAFFWGYLVLQIAGGSLGERYGAKRVIAGGMFPVAVLNLLTPVAARASPYLLLILRVLLGVGESVMYPATQALWARWSPPHERSSLIGFSYAGGQFGNAVMFPIGGLLAAYGADGGWPTVFYFIGSVGFGWCLLWMYYATDTPNQMKGISEIERKYINAYLGARPKNLVKESNEAKRKIPWIAILTSKPLLAILVGHTCGNYGAYMLLTKIPAYMKEVLKFDIESNGFYSMLPYLAFWIFITMGGIIADALITREIFSVKNTRKIMGISGLLIPAAFLIGTGFMECDQAIGAVIMLTLSVGFCGLQFSGFFVNHGDIAPQYAGTMFGITNTMATVPGIVSPYVVSAMTPNGTREEWLATFYVAAAIYVFGAIVYFIFAQGEVQSWAIPKAVQEKADDEEKQDGGMEAAKEIDDFPDLEDRETEL